MTDPWRTAYQIGIVGNAIEFALLTTLFLILWPRSRMERATLFATAGMLGIFGTLAFWLLSSQTTTSAARVYPPLVVAFWVSVATLGWFTFVAWRDWVCRRWQKYCDE